MEEKAELFKIPTVSNSIDEGTEADPSTQSIKKGLLEHLKGSKKE